MEYQQLIANMSPEIYARLVRAVELGKWPDGRVLEGEQRENALQAIIAWGQCHLPEAERVGFIPRKKRAPASGDPEALAPLTWQERE